MRSKRNLWPLGIFLSFAMFVAGTACLIVMAARNPNDLVSANYYEDEVRCQTHFDQLDRARNLTQPISARYSSAQHGIVITIPTNHSSGAVAGRVELYRPSAARFDKRFELNIDGSGVQFIDTSRLVSGLWIVKIDWTANGQQYRHEQKLVIGEHKL